MDSKCFAVRVVLSLGLLVAPLTTAQDQPTVTVEQGVLVGTTTTFQESEFINVNKAIDVFKGIPFAEPPVGPLRFKPPLAKQPWEGTYNATHFRNACVQGQPEGGLPFPVSEDCLQLNIYAPRPKLQGGAAVMVWIHAGGFLIGSAMMSLYNGESLVALGDVIIVTINYRLNVFGFLTTGDEGAPGNVGLLDQVLALKWIKKNIAAFGGDSKRITIFGESAGSASVSLLLLSKKAKGLFNNAILESGTAFSPWAFSDVRDRLRQEAFDFGERLGCSATESTALLSCLRGKNSTALIAAVQSKSIQRLTPPVVVDGTFLDDTPANLYASGQYNHAKILLGSTKDEGTYFTFKNRLFSSFMTTDKVPLLEREVFDQALSEEVANFFDGSNDLLVAAIKQQYVDWSQADKENASYFQSYVNYLTDCYFACGTDRVARYHVYGGDDVFMYQMTRAPNGTLENFGGGVTWLGAYHTADIWFVFGAPFIPEFQPSYVNRLRDDKALSVKFMEFWTSFAKTGAPGLKTPDSSPGSGTDVWPKFTIPELEYMVLDVNLSTSRALKSEECHFWNAFFVKLRTLPGQNCTFGIWRETSKGHYSCVIEQDLCDTLDCQDKQQQRCAAAGMFAVKLLTALVAFTSLILAKQ